ncbi:protein-L-isoaspartate(D-aspartate) O-methyltransferase [Marinomonas ostreistagni]|uniref:protein-L-isoaspartate(D-aspartate) O-methyltransferase n=1 Tax=Marinomonas ostreistagni TaxID=359209 RepID=UPI00194E89D9|nr:protein-L-isoaspartate(D-aspartate) O-methyltransferase [Marinomonas ostreistagni]MBM6551338.1 protein-L-isoaspartate(D-aspartate) O-methyltransferase [Marinomonas ostreistagni]
MTTALDELLKSSQARVGQMLHHLQQQGIEHTELLQVMASLPRHEFVEPAFSHLAYSPTSLPIGRNQTISQPLTVARMTLWLLQYARLGRVLEVGTGSGYQTAILAHFFNKVHTIERQRSLHQLAQARLQRMALNNVECLHGDGHLGWPQKVQMDAIIVTAMASKVPSALTDMLKEDGILIMPIADHPPTIGCWRRQGDKWKRLESEAAQFVPLLEGKIDA